MDGRLSIRVLTLLHVQGWIRIHISTFLNKKNEKKDKFVHILKHKGPKWKQKR